MIIRKYWAAFKIYIRGNIYPKRAFSCFWCCSPCRVLWHFLNGWVLFKYYAIHFKQCTAVTFFVPIQQTRSSHFSLSFSFVQLFSFFHLLIVVFIFGKSPFIFRFSNMTILLLCWCCYYYWSCIARALFLRICFVLFQK